MQILNLNYLIGKTYKELTEGEKNLILNIACKIGDYHAELIGTGLKIRCAWNKNKIIFSDSCSISYK